MTDLLTRPNPTLGTPVYQQLVDQVCRAVAAGALRPGDQLPAVRPLARNLVVSPNSVIRAYSALEQNGIITQRPDAGARLADGCARLAQRSAPTAEEAARVSQSRDIEAAAEVQRRLLPQDCPVVAGLDYAGTSRPARGVGGDYYDFIPLSDDRLAIAVGDVCGKGAPAALLMATLRAYVRAQTLGEFGPRPNANGDLTALANNLNRLVYECSSANRYATFFYAEYDAAARALTYVNAGHLPPVIVRRTAKSSEVIRLDCSGPVIGLMLEATYESRRIVLRPGDVLAIVTDGLGEALNRAGDEHGDDAVIAGVVARLEQPARVVADGLIDDTDSFAAGAPQYDDMTVVALRVL